MQTFDQHLMDLVQQGAVDYDTAVANASNPSDFELQMRTFRRKSRVLTEPAAASPSAEPAKNRRRMPGPTG
jgi:twitching motility protein PilU